MKTVFKNKLYKNSAIEIRRSDKDEGGWGVFARRNIKKHSILEQSPVIVVDIKEYLKSHNVTNIPMDLIKKM